MANLRCLEFRDLVSLHPAFVPAKYRAVWFPQGSFQQKLVSGWFLGVGLEAFIGFYKVYAVLCGLRNVVLVFGFWRYLVSRWFLGVGLQALQGSGSRPLRFRVFGV